MSDWRPIETAPKDGTYVLLFDRNDDVPCVARWVNGRWLPDESFVDAEGGWDGAIVVSETSGCKFTHWMPVPEPPEE